MILVVLFPGHFLLARKMATQSMQINAGLELTISMDTRKLYIFQVKKYVSLKVPRDNAKPVPLFSK